VLPIAGTITDPATTLHPSFREGNMLSLARKIAQVVHEGQTRKGTGEPYFNHIARVASRVESVREKTIAYLHDVIEDTDVTAATLHQLGFPALVVMDVLSLSRISGETYAEFIEGTIQFGSDDALRVKLADLQDNLDDRWTADKDGLRARYIRSDITIRAELSRRGSDHRYVDLGERRPDGTLRPAYERWPNGAPT